MKHLTHEGASTINHPSSSFTHHPNAVHGTMPFRNFEFASVSSQATVVTVGCVSCAMHSRIVSRISSCCVTPARSQLLCFAEADFSGSEENFAVAVAEEAQTEQPAKAEAPASNVKEHQGRGHCSTGSLSAEEGNTCNLKTVRFLLEVVLCGVQCPQ